MEKFEQMVEDCFGDWAIASDWIDKHEIAKGLNAYAIEFAVERGLMHHTLDEQIELTDRAAKLARKFADYMAAKKESA